MSENFYELLKKIPRDVAERCRDELREIADSVKLGNGNVIGRWKKASGMIANDFPTNDEKDETHQMMMEIELLLIPDLEKHPVDSWGVPVKLPGADVLVPQESKHSFRVGCWRAVPHGITQSSPKCVGIGGSEMAYSELLAVK